MRLLGGGLTLVVVSRLTEGPWRWPSRTQVPWVLLGALGVAVYQFSFFLGTERTGVAVGTVVAIGAAPLAGGVLALIVDRHRPAVHWVAGTAVAVIGIATLTLRNGTVELDAVGLTAAVTAGAAYAVYALAAGRMVRTGSPSSRAMAYVFLTAGAALSPVLVTDGLDWLRGPGPIAVMVHLSVVTIGVSYVLFGRGVGALPLGVVMTITLVEPTVATILGVGVLGEPLGPLGAVALIAVLVGVAVASRPASKADA